MSKKKLRDEDLAEIENKRNQKIFDDYNNPQDPNTLETTLKKDKIKGFNPSKSMLDEEFEDQKELQKDDLSAQQEFDTANLGINRLYEIGKAGAEKYAPGLGQLFDWIKGKAEGKDVQFPVQLLLKEQKDLPLEKTKGLLKEQKDLPAETTVPLDVIEDFPAIQTIYKREGLNPEQKGLLQNIFSKIYNPLFINNFIKKYDLNTFNDNFDIELDINNMDINDTTLYNILEENSTSIDWIILNMTLTSKWVDFNLCGIEIYSLNCIAKISFIITLFYKIIQL